MKMNGARILVEELIHQGVDVIFGYPGGAVLNIYDELYFPPTNRALPMRLTDMRGPAEKQV